MQASKFKHKRSTLERIEKYISPIYFTDVNLYGQLYREKVKVERILHYAAPDRVPFSDVKDKEFIPTEVGEDFGPTWATHWFKLNITIPSKWKGKEVRLLWNSSSEAMVFDPNGKPLQGLTGCQPDKSYYQLCEKFDGGNQNHVLYIEMACNTLFGAGGGSMIAPPDPNKYFTLSQVEIAVHDNNVSDLLIDLEIMHDLAKHLPEQNPRSYEALYAGNEVINVLTQEDSNSSLETAKKLTDKFFSEKSNSTQIVHAIGHCHIDTAWLWPYAETVRKCARSWASVISIMKKNPNFTFACSQAQQFQWIKEKYPLLFDDIKVYVKKGQFLPVGGCWVEMDGNIPSGESFIRQFLYGQKFFTEEFGFASKEMWLPDTFGYSAQLPQIMNICGVKRFLTQKLSWNLVNKFPHHNFVWQGIDGSSVIVHFPPADSYETEVKVEEVLKTMTNLMDKGRVKDSMLLYGYGDGGGGPTEAMLKRQRRLENINSCPRVNLSTPDEFFPSIEADREKLCKWVGELYLELHNGTYTTHHRIKQENRQSEYSLRDAEFYSSICLVKSGSDGKIYPKDDLEEAWKLVLLNQFHDVLPGSSIEMVYKDAHRFFAKVLGIAAEISKACLEVLFGRSNTKTVVSNTLSWDRASLVSIESSTLSNLSRNNSGVHFQDLSSGKKLIPVNVPATGYLMLTDLQPIKHCVIAEKLPSGLYHLKNEYLEVLIDSMGRIASLKTADNDMEVVPHGSFVNQFITFSDIPLYWDAWDVMDYHLETGKPVTKVVEEIRLEEKGPLRATISLKLQISNDSYIKQQISLDVAHPYVKVDANIEWKEAHQFLKVEFPVNIHSDKATYEIQFGHVQRPTHHNTSWDSARFEVCGHKWADLSEHDWGVAILNDSCYGHSVHDNVMRMSLLRSPKSPDGNADMGNHDFSYAIYPHRGTFQAAKVIQHAYELNVPVKVLSNGINSTTNEDHPITDAAPPIEIDFRHSWFTLSNPAIILEAVKKSEKNSDRLLLRMFEAYGSHSITELKTTLPLKTALFCNAIEEPLANDVLDFKDQCISLTFKPFEVVSLLVNF